MSSGLGPQREGSSTPPTPAELVTRHQVGVWRYLRVLGCDAATADDLTQEALLAVLQRDSLQHISDAATASYLRRTAKNLYISLQRRSGRVQLVAEVEKLDQVWTRWAGADLSGEDLQSILKQCFEKLTPRAQKALRLRFASKTSRVEIGEALGITEHGAKNLMQRAKKQLKECIDESRS